MLVDPLQERIEEFVVRVELTLTPKTHIFSVFMLEIKYNLTTLRGEKASSHLQFIKNFSFFHLFLSTNPTR